MLAVLVVLIVIASAAGPARAAGTSSRAGAQGSAGDDEVTCPTDLDGVPLSLDEDFAGTPRALANDEGVLVRFSLLCPYVDGDGTVVAELNLAWSRYAADDLECRALEPTSEDTGEGRVEGVVDHPSRSAAVTFEAAEEVLPAVEEAATELLTEVPADAYPCAGRQDSGVDASVAPSRDEESTGVPLVPALALLAATAVLVLVVVLLARRSRSRAQRRVAAGSGADGVTDAGESSAGALAAALRAERVVGEQADPGPPGGPGPIRTDPFADERRSLQAARHRALADRGAIELLLAEAQADLAVHREHAAAVRRLAASAAAGGERREFLSSYAGVMALAVAATNLVSTSARRAAALAGDRGTGGHADVAGPAAQLDALHDLVIAAAERGLGDSRFWLWQDRRLTVVQAVAAVGRAVPRLVAVQQRLVQHVAVLAERHRQLVVELAELDLAVAELDRRASDGDDRSLERAGV